MTKLRRNLIKQLTTTMNSNKNYLNLFSCIFLLIFSCKSKNDQEEILKIVHDKFISPTFYPSLLNNNKINLDQKTYDISQGMISQEAFIDSLQYSKIILNNHFTYTFSNYLYKPKLDKTIKFELVAIQEIDTIQKSSNNKIDFSFSNEKKNIKRLQNKKQNPKGSIFIGNYRASYIYFNKQHTRAYIELSRIHNKDSTTYMELSRIYNMEISRIHNTDDSTSYPIFLEKINGKWHIK